MRGDLQTGERERPTLLVKLQPHVCAISDWLVPGWLIAVVVVVVVVVMAFAANQPPSFSAVQIWGGGSSDYANEVGCPSCHCPSRQGALSWPSANM